MIRVFTTAQRDALLESLRAGCTDKQAIRAACGNLPAWALQAFDVLRTNDAEVGEAAGRSGAKQEEVPSLATAANEEVHDVDADVVGRGGADAGGGARAIDREDGGVLPPGSGSVASDALHVAAHGTHASEASDSNDSVAAWARLVNPREAAHPVARSRRASEATDTGMPDWEAIREEAGALSPGPFGFILYQEQCLARSGANFPALSPYSLWMLCAFFASMKRWLLLMAGRGFGKSTLGGRILTALGLTTARKVAPGPSWVCPIVSVLPVDADRRLEDVQAVLLHGYHVELKISLGKSMIVTTDSNGNPIAWVSSASTIGNVSGPSSFAALVDEEEKILNGRAGEIVGSLAYTFRSRAGVRGFRVSSAMTSHGTLAGDCAKGATVTNFVATLGPFLVDAVAGLFAVAMWEATGDAANHRAPNPEAAAAIRVHALSLTEESWQVPTWLGHPSIGRPDDATPWGPSDAAVATRIEAEAVPERIREGIPSWRYWLRECASVPIDEDEAIKDWDGGDDLMGEPSRYADELAPDRGYDER